MRKPRTKRAVASEPKAELTVYVASFNTSQEARQFGDRVIPIDFQTVLLKIKGDRDEWSEEHRLGLGDTLVIKLTQVP